MKVKLGFLVEELKRSGTGTTNPEKDFVRASVKAWFKKVGDRVEKGEPIAEIETDKVTEELGSAWRGRIAALYYEPGDNWELGVTKNGEELGSRTQDTPYGKILLPELGCIETDDVTPKDTAEVEEAPEELTKESKDTEAPPEEPSRVRAAPAARKLAREAGIDINTLRGTGPGERIMRADVEAAIALSDPPSEQSETNREQKADREPLGASQIRKTIARLLTKSHSEIPPAGDAITVDVTHLWKFYRERKATWREDTGTDFSFTSIFMFLAARLMSDQREKFGIINAYWDKDAEEGYLFKAVNMGIAVQAPDGLMVPVIHGAEKLSFRELVAATHDKVQRALTRKIALADLRDLTFTVNNVGAMGGESPDPITPYAVETDGSERPTAMILALGKVMQFPGDSRHFVTLAFRFDHRLFDGEQALRFVGEMKRYIESKENPDEFRELFEENFTIKQPPD